LCNHDVVLINHLMQLSDLLLLLLLHDPLRVLLLKHLMTQSNWEFILVAYVLDGVFINRLVDCDAEYVLSLG
jgi:hypothetical protein